MNKNGYIMNIQEFHINFEESRFTDLRKCIAETPIGKVTVPTAIARFPKDILLVPKPWIELPTCPVLGNALRLTFHRHGSSRTFRTCYERVYYKTTMTK